MKLDQWFKMKLYSTHHINTQYPCERVNILSLFSVFLFVVTTHRNDLKGKKISKHKLIKIMCIFAHIYKQYDVISAHISAFVYKQFVQCIQYTDDMTRKILSWYQAIKQISTFSLFC